MKYKIIVDSSSDLIKEYYNSEDIEFEVVPLTIHIKDKEFIDDENIDIKEMLDQMHHTLIKATSSCPSPGSYLESMTADYNFIITITSKLSGSFGSANLAISMLEDKKALAIDSLGTAGMLELIVMKLIELIRKGLSFEEISKKILEFRDSLNLFFILKKFDNLVKNGRMSKLVAIVAKIAYISPLCKADNGEIKIFKKIRTRKACINELITEVGNAEGDYKDRYCIVSHAFCEEDGNMIKQALDTLNKFKGVIVRKMRGLCSFYALEEGIIVTY